MFLPASPVGEHTGSEKLAGFCPCGRRWTNYFLQGADRIQLKSGMSIPEMNKNYWATHRVQINLWSESLVRRFFIDGTNTLKIVAFKWTIRKFE
jgi:hypothetical protein